MEMMMNDADIFSRFESHRGPRKRKRNGEESSGGIMVSRARNSRRADAPNITSPCPECNRTFWSWKALFGHMRCHPTRQYRGMNPPENLRRRRLGKAPVEVEEEFTEEDHELASCLLLLTNGSSHQKIRSGEENTAVGPTSSGAVTQSSSGFECSSCKKVFNSHQALGGHRATHKNVKGCYAITAAGCCSSTTKTAAAGEPTSPIDLNLSASDGRSFIEGGLILDLKLGL